MHKMLSRTTAANPTILHLDSLCSVSCIIATRTQLIGVFYVTPCINNIYCVRAHRVEGGQESKRKRGRETERPTVGQSVDDCSVKSVAGAKCVHQRFGGEGLRLDQNPVWTQRCCPCLCPGTHQDGPKGATQSSQSHREGSGTWSDH